MRKDSVAWIHTLDDPDLPMDKKLQLKSLPWPGCSQSPPVGVVRLLNRWLERQKTMTLSRVTGY